METRTEEYLLAAERFGKLLEDDPPGIDEYRDLSELSDRPEAILGGIARKVAYGMDLAAARFAANSLAHYHEGLGGQVWGPITIMYRTTKLYTAICLRPVEQFTPEQKRAFMNLLKDGLNELDQDRISLLRARTQVVARKYQTHVAELSRSLTKPDKQSSSQLASIAQERRGCSLAAAIFAILTSLLLP